MKNSHLFELMRLNKSLVYFSTSLNSNKNTLAKVKRLNDFKAYEADFDLLDDVSQRTGITKTAIMEKALRYYLELNKKELKAIE